MSRRMTQLDIDQVDERREAARREEDRRAEEPFGWKKWALGILGGVLSTLTVATLLGWVGSAGAQDRRLYAIENAHALLDQRVTVMETLSQDTNRRMREVEKDIDRLVLLAQAEELRAAAGKKAKR